jgi:signal transduction histidine kinase
MIHRPASFATVRAVSIVTDGSQTSAGRTRAPAFASLSDEAIRQVRMGICAFVGLTCTIVGVVQLLNAAESLDPWERANGIVYTCIAACCYLALALARTKYLRTSEWLLLLAGHFGVAAVIITGAPGSSLIAGMAASSLLVLFPGIALRARTARWSALNALAVGLVYVLSVVLRLTFHSDGEPMQPGDVAIKLLVPPTSFWVEWLMVRALNRRILEALSESERSRSALAVSNQLLELANRSLETARVEAERVRDGAEAANRAKSMFLANMSHELRTPLNSIIGYTELIMDEGRDDETRRIRDVVPDLKNVVLSAKHLLGLIGGILDLSKIEAGRMELVQEQFGVLDFIREVEQTIAPQVRKRNNALIVRCPEDLGVVVADRGKLKQVLLNLLGNAVKFTNDGEITLGATRDREQSMLIFEVRDTGIGIEPDKLAVIFDKFTQIDASPTRRYEGAGLGLAITRELCAMMGASVDVQSRPGTGTCFTVSLPIQIAIPSASFTHGPAASSSSAML